MAFMYKPTFLRSAVLEDPLGWGDLLTPQDVLEFEEKYPDLFLKPSVPTSISVGDKPSVAPKKASVKGASRNSTPSAGTVTKIAERRRAGPDFKRLSELAKPVRHAKDQCVPSATTGHKSSRQSNSLMSRTPSSVPTKTLSARHESRGSKSEANGLNICEQINLRTTPVVDAPCVVHAHKSVSAEAAVAYYHCDQPVLLFRKSRSQPVSLSHAVASKSFKPDKLKVKSHTPKGVVAPPVNAALSKHTIKKRREMMKQVESLKKRLKNISTSSSPKGSSDNLKQEIFKAFTDRFIRSNPSKPETKKRFIEVHSDIRASDVSLDSLDSAERFQVLRSDSVKTQVISHNLPDIAEEDSYSESDPSTPVSSLSGKPRSAYRTAQKRNSTSSNLGKNSEVSSNTNDQHVRKYEQLLLTNILAEKYAKEGKFRDEKPLLPRSPRSPIMLEEVKQKEHEEVHITSSVERSKLQSQLMEEIAHELIFAEILRMIEEEKQVAATKRTESIRKSIGVGTMTELSVKENIQKSIAVGTVTQFAEKETITENILIKPPIKSVMSVGVETSFESHAVDVRSPIKALSKSDKSPSMSSPVKRSTKTSPIPLPSFPKAKPEFLQLLMGGSERFLHKSSSATNSTSQLTNPLGPNELISSTRPRSVGSQISHEATDCSELEDFAASSSFELPGDFNRAHVGANVLQRQPTLLPEVSHRDYSETNLKSARRRTDEKSAEEIQSLLTTAGNRILNSFSKSLDLSELEVSMNSILDSIISEGELVWKNSGSREAIKLKSPGEVSLQFPGSPDVSLDMLLKDLALSSFHIG